MKTSKLQLKFTLIIGLTVTLIFAMVVIFITLRTNTIVVGDALKNTEEKADAFTQNIEQFLNEGVFTARALAKSFEAYPAFPEASRRTTYAQLLRQQMNLNERFKSIWVTLEPNTLDNNDAKYRNADYSNEVGRYVATWYRENGKLIASKASEEEIDTSKYYQQPKKLRKEVIIEPYKYKYSENGKEYYLTSICIPINDANGKFMGVVGIDIDLADLQNFISNEKQIMAIFSNDGQVVAHFDQSRIGKRAVETEADMLGNENVKQLASNIKSGKVFSMEFFAGAIQSQAYIVVSPIHIGKTEQPWGFGYAIPLKVVLAKTYSLRLVVIMFAVIGLVILLSILYFLIKGISKPIVQVAEYAKKISEGDLTATISIKRNDEIGDMVNSLKTMGERLTEIISNIVAGAINVTSASNQFSSTTVQIAQGANEQASSAEEVSSSVEEMNSTIQQNTDNAVQTERIATNTAQSIIEVSQASQKSLDATRQIAEKIKIINAIAEKTDILAINAAIEAARAGEHGKGFAVVAAEVRKLAETSQRAAIEINSLSATSLKVTEDAGSLMMKIIPDIQKTATLVQEISAASIEQSSGANQIVKAIEQLSQVTQQNSAAAEEMSSTAEELASQAESLQETISFFNTGEMHKKEKSQVIHLKNNKTLMPKVNVSKGIKMNEMDLKEEEEFIKY